jgi:hypothetical protein
MLLNLAQTAEKLGISQTSVKRLVEAGTLPNVPFGNPSSKRKTLRFDENVVKTFKKAGTQFTAPTTNGQPAPTIVTPTGTILPTGYVTTRQAAEILGWKQQRVHDVIKSGRLTDTKFGNRSFLSPEEVERAKTFTKSGPLLGTPVTTVAISNGNGTYIPAGTPLPVTVPSSVSAFAHRLNNVDTRLTGIENDLAAIKLALQDLVKAFA